MQALLAEVLNARSIPPYQNDNQLDVGLIDDQLRSVMEQIKRQKDKDDIFFKVDADLPIECRVKLLKSVFDTFRKYLDIRSVDCKTTLRNKFYPFFEVVEDDFKKACPGNPFVDPVTTKFESLLFIMSNKPRNPDGFAPRAIMISTCTEYISGFDN